MLKNKPILISFLGCLLLYGFAYFQAQSLEGGQDTWHHFLISKYAIKYPNLLIDQWNKPVFTWCTTLFCNIGLWAMVWFNLFCALISGVLIALSLKKENIANEWLAIPLLCFCPIVFGNTISCLTEPLNILMLCMVIYLWQIESKKTAIALASFLPYLRTEGFVICGAIFVFLIFKKEFRLLLWLLLGSIILNFVGFAITGHLFWIITENPYLKAELESTFDPGKGSLLHYIRAARQIFGLPLLLLFILGNILFIYEWIKHKKNDLILLSLLIFWSYFAAHTVIYYLGILGSHGLTRVMAVIAPCMVVVVLYFLSFIIKVFKIENKYYKIEFSILFTFIVIWVGYKETGYAKPHRYKEPTVKIDKLNSNIEKAGNWLLANNLMQRTIIHQSPYFNVKFNKDEYDVKSSYYIWSINKEGDWAEKGVIVIWEPYYCTREGNMPLAWLQNNANYKLLKYIEGKDENEQLDKQLDIYIFEKIKF